MTVDGSYITARAAALAADLQQVAQVAHVGRALEREYALDQRGALRRPQHRRDEIAAFGDNLRARHGVVAGAAHGLDVLAELRAVGERDLDDRLPDRKST